MNATEKLFDDEIQQHVGNQTAIQLEEDLGRFMLKGLVKYFLIWYLPLILVIGTFGAVFCMLFIFMSRMLPKIIQVWLVSICFGDFMILIWDVLRLFLKLAFDYDYIDQGIVICKLQSYFSSFFFHWSAYNQAAMSIQRLVFIASPLRSRTILSTRRVLTLWASMTFLLVFPNITYLIYWHIGKKSDCEPVDKWFYYVTTLVHLIAWGIIPLTSMVVSTGCISYRLIRYRRGNFKAKKSKDGESGGVPQPAVIGGRRHGSDQGAHVTRLLVSMNLFYLFTTFPLLIYMMYLNFVKDNQVGKSIAQSLHKFYYYLFRSICFLNASLNWVFYCAAGKIFRQRAMQILYRIFCRRRNQYRGGYTGGGRYTTTNTQQPNRQGQRSTSATPVAFQQVRRADTLAASSELLADDNNASPMLSTTPSNAKAKGNWGKRLKAKRARVSKEAEAEL